MSDAKKPSERSGKRGLPQLRASDTRLEQPTIMDRALAAQYGSPYVQLVAFAVDVDRAYVETQDDEALPFGWEVFLTECYVLGAFGEANDEALDLLEDCCQSILEQAPEDQGFGSQLLFAVHDATARGLLSARLSGLFEVWKRPPKQLRKALDALLGDPGTALSACAKVVLAAPLDPKLAPPTRQTLERMRDGAFRLPGVHRSQA